MNLTPTWNLAHLAHVELLTPTADESLRFFTDVMGMYVSLRQGDSVYLRAYDDYEHHTLQLTAHTHAGIGHLAWRVRSPDVLTAMAERLAASGAGVGWMHDNIGHGPSYRFRMPSGHLTEIYFESYKHRAEGAEVSALKNTASRFPARGMNVRRLDHVNLLAPDVAAFQAFQLSHVGGRVSETIIAPDGSVKGAWFSVNSKSYDMAVTEDHVAGATGRFHHVTYAVNSREEVLLAADIALEHGVFIETGPHKHAIQQTFFLYLYEPGGNRVEVANATARLLLDPDHAPVVWSLEERKKGQAWGLQTVPSFHTHGTPMPDDL